MRQGINIKYILNRRNTTELRSLEEAVSLCKEAGFCELDYLSAWDCDDYADVAHRSREILERNGCCVHQSHSPMFRYKPNGIELFLNAAPRVVEISSILGAKYLVVHADEWPVKGEDYNCKLALEKNYELIAPVVEMCAKHGITLAIENLFDENSRNDDNGRTRFCAKQEDLLGLLSLIGKENIGICLDTGHAYVSYLQDILDFVTAVAPYVVCTHVHDNRGSDAHLPAFVGSLPLEEVFSILKRNGYAGNLCWEMSNGSGRFPDEIMPEFLRFLYKSGLYLGTTTGFAMN